MPSLTEPGCSVELMVKIPLALRERGRDQQRRRRGPGYSAVYDVGCVRSIGSQMRLRCSRVTCA